MLCRVCIQGCQADRHHKSCSAGQGQCSLHHTEEGVGQIDRCSQRDKGPQGNPFTGFLTRAQSRLSAAALSLHSPGDQAPCFTENPSLFDPPCHPWCRSPSTSACSSQASQVAILFIDVRSDPLSAAFNAITVLPSIRWSAHIQLLQLLGISSVHIPITQCVPLPVQRTRGP